MCVCADARMYMGDARVCMGVYVYVYTHVYICTGLNIRLGLLIIGN